MPNISIEEAKQIMNGPANYFGPTLDEFLGKNPDFEPEDVNEEEKLRLWRNQGKYNFFGPDEWNNYFHGKIDLTNVSSIPWSKEDLENPIIKAPHFLFLGMDFILDKFVTIPLLLQLFSGPTHPKFYYSLAKGRKSEINLRQCVKKWYLMKIDGFGSPGSIYEDLAFSLPIEYQPAHAVERALANILFYLLNQVYLDSDFTLVNDALSPKSGMAMISSFQDDGILIDSDEASAYSAIAASRRTKEEIELRKLQNKEISNYLDDLRSNWK